MIEFLQQPQRVLSVITKDDLARLTQEHGLRVQTLAEVQYFNPAGVRLRTLLWPDPARDLETVLLVTNRVRSVAPPPSASTRRWQIASERRRFPTPETSSPG